MTVRIPVNGQVFEYPQTGDINWGSQATGAFVRLNASTLQYSTRTFILTHELSFGPNFGIRVKSLRTDSSSASTQDSDGAIRLGGDEKISFGAGSNPLKLSSNADQTRLDVNGNEVLTTSDSQTISNKALDGTNTLPNKYIQTKHLADNLITSAQIQNGAIVSEDIANRSDNTGGNPGIGLNQVSQSLLNSISGGADITFENIDFYKAPITAVLEETIPGIDAVNKTSLKIEISAPTFKQGTVLSVAKDNYIRVTKDFKADINITADFTVSGIREDKPVEAQLMIGSASSVTRLQYLASRDASETTGSAYRYKKEVISNTSESITIARDITGASFNPVSAEPEVYMADQRDIYVIEKVIVNNDQNSNQNIFQPKAKYTITILPPNATRISGLAFGPLGELWCTFLYPPSRNSSDVGPCRLLINKVSNNVTWTPLIPNIADKDKDASRYGLEYYRGYLYFLSDENSNNWSRINATTRQRIEVLKTISDSVIDPRGLAAYNEKLYVCSNRTKFIQEIDPLSGEVGEKIFFSDTTISTGALTRWFDTKLAAISYNASSLYAYEAPTVSDLAVVNPIAIGESVILTKNTNSFTLGLNSQAIDLFATNTDLNKGLYLVNKSAAEYTVSKDIGKPTDVTATERLQFDIGDTRVSSIVLKQTLTIIPTIDSASLPLLNAPLSYEGRYISINDGVIVKAKLSREVRDLLDDNAVEVEDPISKVEGKITIEDGAIGSNKLSLGIQSALNDVITGAVAPITVNRNKEVTILNAAIGSEKLNAALQRLIAADNSKPLAPISKNEFGYLTINDGAIQGTKIAERAITESKLSTSVKVKLNKERAADSALADLAENPKGFDLQETVSSLSEKTISANSNNIQIEDLAVNSPLVFLTGDETLEEAYAAGSYGVVESTVPSNRAILINESISLRKKQPSGIYSGTLTNSIVSQFTYDPIRGDVNLYVDTTRFIVAYGSLVSSLRINVRGQEVTFKKFTGNLYQSSITPGFESTLNISISLDAYSGHYSQIILKNTPANVQSGDKIFRVDVELQHPTVNLESSSRAAILK